MANPIEEARNNAKNAQENWRKNPSSDESFKAVMDSLNRLFAAVDSECEARNRSNPGGVFKGVFVDNSRRTLPEGSTPNLPKGNLGDGFQGDLPSGDSFDGWKGSLPKGDLGDGWKG